MLQHRLAIIFPYILLLLLLPCQQVGCGADVPVTTAIDPKVNPIVSLDLDNVTLREAFK